MALLERLPGPIRELVESLADAVPPYVVVDGVLESKWVDNEGRPIICIEGHRVEVDHETFEDLAVGDHLRVRATRGGVAIAIDRLVGHR